MIGWKQRRVSTAGNVKPNERIGNSIVGHDGLSLGEGMLARGSRAPCKSLRGGVPKILRPMIDGLQGSGQFCDTRSKNDQQQTPVSNVRHRPPSHEKILSNYPGATPFLTAFCAHGPRYARPGKP